MFEREFRELSFVPRWAIARTIRTQSVAEHSYYVTLYAAQTARMIKWRHIHVEDQLLHHALMHDVGEAFMGDITGPAKRWVVNKTAEHVLEEKLIEDRFGSPFGNIIPDLGIKEIVKFADMLDQVLFIQTDIQLGNQTLGRGMENLYIPHQGAPNICSAINLTLIQAWNAMLPYSNLTKEEFYQAWQKLVIAIDGHRAELSRILDNPPASASK